jgi:diguanylate cyclase (GGDEF)-like protein
MHVAILSDYYAILQVHFLAEPEVIESAYKRLAKKYHPDVNKTAGSDVRMKKINEAYETLRDSYRRKAYDAERALRQAPVRAPSYARPAYDVRPEPKKDADILCPAQAKDTLTRYFTLIKAKDFAGAYDVITTADKKNITLDDFVKWQSGVGRIYGLQDCSFKADRLEMNVRLNGQAYSQAVTFAVKTVEHNTIMGRLEKDTISKKVVLEDTAWRIYVGFDDIAPYIARFEELSGLLAAKSVINDMVEHYSYKDSVTGLYNKKGFAEAAQREVWRYSRYGNVFSVMLLEVDPTRDILRPKSQELLRHTASWAGKILSDSFRKLDILGRWGETGFIVLLPETKLNDCVRAARKLIKIFDTSLLVYSRKKYGVKLSIGLEEFRGSLEDTIRNLGDYIAAAAKNKRSSIVFKNGIIE